MKRKTGGFKVCFQIQLVPLHLGCTPAQALLAWNLRRGVCVILKSVTAERIAENGGEATWAGAALGTLPKYPSFFLAFWLS